MTGKNINHIELDYESDYGAWQLVTYNATDGYVDQIWLSDDIGDALAVLLVKIVSSKPR